MRIIRIAYILAFTSYFIYREEFVSVVFSLTTVLWALKTINPCTKFWHNWDDWRDSKRYANAKSRVCKRCPAKQYMHGVKNTKYNEDSNGCWTGL